jgi:hypothetical protein
MGFGKDGTNRQASLTPAVKRWNRWHARRPNNVQGQRRCRRDVRGWFGACEGLDGGSEQQVARRILPLRKIKVSIDALHRAPAVALARR